MAGIGIEVGFRKCDRSWVTGIETKVGDRNWDRSWFTGNGLEGGLQAMRLTGILTCS